MSRNMKLLIVFAVLVLVVLGKKFTGSDENRNFRDVLVELDTARITKVSLISKVNDFRPIELVRTGSKWEVSNGITKDDVDEGSLRAMLITLVRMTPKRLIARSDDKWNQYEVTDSLGTRVKVFGRDEVLADLMVGKFNFQQTSRSMSTFVRLSEDKDVYSVEGFLSSTFITEFNSLRNRTFLNTQNNDLNSLRFDYPGDSSFVMSKVGQTWQVNDTVLDSALVEKYLSGISSMTQQEFVDDFDIEGITATYRLTIDGNNMNTITVSGYQNGDDLILHSSMNADAYFRKDTAEIFEKLFISSSKFILKIHD